MTQTLVVVAGLGVAAATALALPARCHGGPRAVTDGPARGQATEPSLRFRLVISIAAGGAAPLWLGERLWVWSLALGAATATAVWVTLGRMEPAGVRRERREARRDLPHLVVLLAATLRAGASPAAGLGLVVEALPGPAADRLSASLARLRLGDDPGLVWRLLRADSVLAPLGRALERAHTSGASVARTVERLAEELARDQRGRAEDRARAVGVRAALPLGLCLLPAFILLGIVPVVGGLVTALLGAP